MTRFTNVEEALKHMEDPRMNEETKWNALSVVLRELFKASGYSTELPINGEEPWVQDTTERKLSDGAR